MPTTIVGDEACPKCRALGRDKTGNHLILFSNGNKYCNRCHYKEVGSVPSSPKKEKATSFKRYDLTTIALLAPQDLPDRKISKATCGVFGIKVEYNEDGTHKSHFYPVTKKGSVTAYKCRQLPKKIFSIGDAIDADLFGQAKFSQGGKKILIAGGELDAASAFEMLVPTKYMSKSYAFVANTYGEGSIKAIEDNLEYVNSFEEVLLALDNDDAGKKATRKLVDLIGDKVKILKFSENDLSDLLTKGKQQEFISAFFNAKPYAPTSIITVNDILEDVLRVPEYGKPFPWKSLTEATYGRRPGDIYYWGAGVKIGKSEALNQMVAHIIEEGGTPFVAKPEEQASLTVKKVAGKIFKKPFHDPKAYLNGVFTQKEQEEAIRYVDNKLWMFNRYGSMDWEELKSCIRYAVVKLGTTDVFIDPLTCFTDGKDGTYVDQMLKGMVRELDQMAKDIGFTAHCFCHLNNPPTGSKTWEEGKEPRSAYFANSRAMMRACQYMIGIARNKYAEDVLVKNTSKFILLEDRNFGKYEKFDVHYNPDTGEYLE